MGGDGHAVQEVPQEATVEATIKAFQSRLKACVDAGDKHFKPPRVGAQIR
jgi:hypothetical protein